MKNKTDDARRDIHTLRLFRKSVEFQTHNYTNKKLLFVVLTTYSSSFCIFHAITFFYFVPLSNLFLLKITIEWWKRDAKRNSSSMIYDYGIEKKIIANSKPQATIFMVPDEPRNCASKWNWNALLFLSYISDSDFTWTRFCLVRVCKRIRN